MSEQSNVCAGCKQETHPAYLSRYDGYCLDCANQGVPERDAEIAQLRARLAEYEGDNKRWHSFETVQAIVKERDHLHKELKIAMSQAIHARAQAAMIAGQRDWLQAQLETARQQLAETERKAIEQSEYIQLHGLTEFEMSRLKAELDAAQMKASQAAEGYEIERQARILAVQQRDAERERCAKIAEQYSNSLDASNIIATAIREE